MAFSVGDLVASLELNDKEFRAGLVRVQGGVRQLDQMLKGFQRSASGALIVPAGLAQGIAKTDSAAKAATSSIDRFRGGLVSLASGAIGLNPQIARLATLLAGFAVSGTVTVVALAGLAALAGGWDLFTRKAKEAREETQLAIDKIRELAAIQEGGLGGEEKKRIAAAQSRLTSMEGGFFSAASWAQARKDLADAEAQYGAVLIDEAKKRKEATSKDKASLEELNDRLFDLNIRAQFAAAGVEEMLERALDPTRFGGPGIRSAALAGPSPSRFFAQLRSTVPVDTSGAGAPHANSIKSFELAIKDFGASVKEMVKATFSGEGLTNIGANLASAGIGMVAGKLVDGLKGFVSGLNDAQRLLAEAIEKNTRALQADGKFLRELAKEAGFEGFGNQIMEGVTRALSIMAVGRNDGRNVFEVLDEELKKAGLTPSMWTGSFKEMLQGWASALGIDVRDEETLRQFLEQLGKAGFGLEDLTETARNTSEALRNVPTGFKIALAMFDATIPGRASGGPVRAGQPYLVGEMGPELFVPGQSGGIVPNGAVGAVAGAGAGVVEVHQHGDVYIDAKSKSARETYEEWMREEARRASRGGGGTVTPRRRPQT